MFQLSGETCAGTNANRLRRRSQAKTPMRKLHNRPLLCTRIYILYLSINKTMSRKFIYECARLMQPRTKEIIAHAASDFNKSVPHLCVIILCPHSVSPAAAAVREVSVCANASARSELFIIYSNKLIMRPGAGRPRESFPSAAISIIQQR
jgi:hypothetical protein